MKISWDDYEELRLLKKELSNKYEVLDFIGENNYLKVFKIRHKILDETRALETAKAGGKRAKQSWEKTRAILKKNAGKLKKFPGLNMPRLYDASSDEVLPFIIREYVEGKSLEDKIREQGIIENHTILEISGTVLRVIGGMHSKNTCHGDLDPAGIIIEKNTGRVVIIDPGLTSDFEEDNDPANEIQVNPLYAAPEKLDGKIIPAGDVYAFGVLLYEMVTGKPPFSGKPMEIARGHRELQVPDILSTNPGAPAGIQRIINRAMSKQPEARYKDVKDILNALHRVLAGKQEDWRVYCDRTMAAVFTIYRKFQRKEILSRSFSRRDMQWPALKRSRFIESILLDIPVPAIYLAEDEDGKQEIIDGQQRLLAIFDYLDNRYALEGLKILDELNNKKSENLATTHIAWQRKLEEYSLTVFIIRKESHPGFPFDICNRLNEGEIGKGGEN